MRLTASQAAQIRDGVARFFGPGSRVWLFGSRLDKRLLGGDIDLYIEPEMQDPASLVDAKLHFLCAMHRQFGEQRIDWYYIEPLFRRRNSPFTGLRKKTASGCYDS